MSKQLLIYLMTHIIMSQAITAQYFGQNKPVYEEFNFELYKTPHFELYHYLSDSNKVTQLANLSEKWYFYHQQVLADTFTVRNPIIFYKNHAHFQQTTAISSRVDVGTGGVTEGFKQRVVMPVTFSSFQTDHVLGHEMVHAFQYNMLSNDPEIGLMSINNVPLWMVEGMAEYLSIGSVSSQTSLWIRDALIHNKFPTLETMTHNYQYSPYRFGHAFWSYISYQYGEQYIKMLFKETAIYGYQDAISNVLMISSDSLSVAWKQTMEKQLITQACDSTFSIIGKRLITKKNGGRYNLNPSISPDGKRIVFLSERDKYGIDLFVANAQTGKIMSRLYTATSHDEIDAINFLETAGSWSPDSRFFTFIAFKKGKSVAIIYDVKKRLIHNEISIPEVDELNWPVWSPNGQKLAMAGLKEGISDIYTYDFDTHELKNLTNTAYSAQQPTWAPDNTKLYFTTDQATKYQHHTTHPFYNLAYVSSDGGKTQIIRTFDNAKNLNPVITSWGQKILFLSDRDGRRNLYAYQLADSSIYQITKYPTGIIGMTEFSPALSVAGDTLCYSMLWDSDFTIYKTTLPYMEENKTLINTNETNLMASRLIPYSAIPSQVETNLYFSRQPYHIQPDSFYVGKIEPRFKLDYIGNIQAGVAAGRFGAGMAGSIEAMFSDILGQNSLYTALAVNGEIYDFGGQVAYLNQKRRFRYGVAISHIPYRYGYYQKSTEPIQEGGDQEYDYIYQRTFEDKISLFTYLPLNKTSRLELGLGYAHYQYRADKISNVSTYNQNYGTKKERIEAPSSFNTGIVDVAFVIDNAKMGLASPVEGKRLRIATEAYLHHLNMQTLLVDYRRYFFIKPYSLAFRIYHYGRYGKDADTDRMTSMFVGSSWYVRGYDTGNFYGDETIDPSTISMNQLIGSRVFVTNMEWRIPFTGPKEIALFPSNFLFSEVALFIDGGIAWNKNSTPSFSLTTNKREKRIPIFSAGIAYRINLFGTIVIEPYYSAPFHQGKFKSPHLGFNLFAGW